VGVTRDRATAAAIAAVQAAARDVTPAELLAQATWDDVWVRPDRPIPRPDGRVALQQPVADAYPAGAALANAVAAGEPEAVGAALRALTLRDGDALLEAALDLARSDAPGLRRHAGHALAHSTDERALVALLDGLAARPELRGGLERSRHPDASRRVRAALEATGVGRFAVHPQPTADDRPALADDDADVDTGLAARATPSKEALEQARAIIDVLVARRDLDAVPRLITLFDGHPDRSLRTTCARALAALGDCGGLAALDARWDDADHIIANIAVRDALQRDPATAWARFGAHIEAVRAGTGSARDERIVGHLLYAAHGGMTPRRLAPDPVTVEPRLVELAAELCRHRQLGDSARMLLADIPRELALAAVRRPRPAAPPPPPAPRPSRRDFLTRYRAGELAVWGELVAHAGAIAEHADLHAEATAVARELMRRVRHNTDVVRATLTASGARVTDDDAPATAVDLAPLVARCGRLPIAFAAMLEVAGSLRLVPAGDDRYDYGTSSLERDGIRLLELDPLELDGLDVIGYAIDDHDQRLEGSHPDIVGPLVLDLAPDYLHKQNVSGGPPYSIALPPDTLAGTVDPELWYQRYGTTLVDYLRYVFRWGGFPGLDVAYRPLARIGLNHRGAFAAVEGPWSVAADRLLAQLRRDLLEF